MPTKIPKIICLMGPTAAGKTEIAIKLSQVLPCNIISVDSAMIYCGMDIGTAKPSSDLLKIAPHRLLDICDPAESYSAGQFREDALREITLIIEQQRIPLLVGGTMLYFHALQNGLAELPRANAEIRAQLNQDAQLYGWQFLHDRLTQIDPLAAQRIHPNDPQRLQRALEIHAISGKNLTSFIAEQKQQKLPYTFINIALSPPRAELHTRISARFNTMLDLDFLAEVEKLLQRGDLHTDLPSMRAVGYRQAWDYLTDKISFTEMQERAVIATRQLAKRQLTWLRSWNNLYTFESADKNTYKQILKIIA